jgi:hypothetical protein
MSMEREAPKFENIRCSSYRDSITTNLTKLKLLGKFRTYDAVYLPPGDSRLDTCRPKMTLN